MIRLTVNGRRHALDVDPETPLLWVLRETLGLTGSKYGCGAAQCGACTVHVNGAAQVSCVLPVGALEGAKILTIEGLGGNHPLQRAWDAEQVAQCGYCQSGQIMSAAALLAVTPKPTDAQIDEAMARNICRCATYLRIRAAIRRASGQPAAPRVQSIIED